MPFVPISIEDYIKIHLKSNPSEKEAECRRLLKATLEDFKNGVKCYCGNDIWVIGSAMVGNMCFTCITGEATPDADYEIDQAMKKNANVQGRRHIDSLLSTKFGGLFGDDGYEINTDLIGKPSLCLTCVHDDGPDDELLCAMNRNEQKDQDDFICGAYEAKYDSSDDSLPF
jgi:hypothetical protein